MNYKLIEIPETESTNTYAKGHRDTEAGCPTVYITDRQTAGRGQRGNSWESEDGKNLTFTLSLHPTWMSASHQFELSMLVSTGIVNALRAYGDEPAKYSVKWPNDIYYGDKKICGILIENSLTDGCIERSLVGIGLNVNQKTFVGDAPNPTSLCLITEIELDRRAVLDNVVNSILDMVEQYSQDPEVDELTALYNSMLWRKDNRAHQWKDASGHSFRATLDRVDPDGRLWLVKEDGETRSYLFKEVSAVL